MAHWRRSPKQPAQPAVRPVWLMRQSVVHPPGSDAEKQPPPQSEAAACGSIVLRIAWSLALSQAPAPLPPPHAPPPPQALPAGHAPHDPPQPSGPHCLPAHCGVQDATHWPA